MTRFSFSVYLQGTCIISTIEEGEKAKLFFFFFNISVDKMPTYDRTMELLDVSFKTLSTLRRPDLQG